MNLKTTLLGAHEDHRPRGVVGEPKLSVGCFEGGGLGPTSNQTACLHPCFQTGWVSNLFGAARGVHKRF